MIDMKKVNSETNKFRKERLNRCISDALIWNSETDDIGSLIPILEDMYALLYKIDDRELEHKCEETVNSIKSASRYNKKVSEVKKKHNKPCDFVICDKDGMCISSLICGSLSDIAADKEPIIIEHIDDRKNWNYY